MLVGKTYEEEKASRNCCGNAEWQARTRRMEYLRRGEQEADEQSEPQQKTQGEHSGEESRSAAQSWVSERDSETSVTAEEQRDEVGERNRPDRTRGVRPQVSMLALTAPRSVVRKNSAMVKGEFHAGRPGTR